jgi:hypothetical protein
MLKFHVPPKFSERDLFVLDVNMVVFHLISGVSSSLILEELKFLHIQSGRLKWY